MPAAILDSATPSSLDLDPKALERLHETITRHVAEGRYPGAQYAVARHGKLAVLSTIGEARTDPSRMAAKDDTLWLLYSNTKVLTACAVWLLVERGALAFTDKIAEHLPGFEQNAKGDITMLQVLTHQGGYPNADVPKAAWTDHDLLRKTVCAFTLEWTPGSRVYYHGRAAHWTAAAVIEAVTKGDYRDFIRSEITAPLGIADECFVGLPDPHHGRAADMHEPAADSGRQVKRAEENNAEFRRAGTPGGGGYATARAMALAQAHPEAGVLLGTMLQCDEAGVSMSCTVFGRRSSRASKPFRRRPRARRLHRRISAIGRPHRRPDQARIQAQRLSAHDQSRRETCKHGRPPPLRASQRRW